MASDPLSLTGVVEIVDRDGALDGGEADGAAVSWVSAIPLTWPWARGRGFFTGRLRWRSQIPTASTMRRTTMAARSRAGAMRLMRPGLGTHGEGGCRSGARFEGRRPSPAPLP